MKRDIQALTQTVYDVLVVGGGIYGACIAWDAAQRGLRVALVEREDFGSGASSNSLKTIHGGLRYLQDGNLRHMRQMIVERRTWLRIAPQLIKPRTFVLLPKKKFTNRRLFLGAAAAINNLMAFDQNHHVEPANRLQAARLISQQTVQEIIPEVSAPFALQWDDGQMVNSERLLLNMLQAAASHGATIANYVEMQTLQCEANRVTGIVARDVLTQQQHEIQAKMTLLCIGQQLSAVEKKSGLPTNPYQPSLAVNLVTPQIIPDYALGATSHTGQTLFIVPWGNSSLIGTLHRTAGPGSQPVTEALIEDFVDQVNSAYPPAQLKTADVQRVHWGYLPATITGERVKLVRTGQIREYASLDGLMAVMSVKFTEARLMAERVVNMIVRKLQHAPIPCQTALTPLAPLPTYDKLQDKSFTQINTDSLVRLQNTYGSRHLKIVRLLAEKPHLAESVAQDLPVLGVEIAYAVRHEMARTLADVILRRTPLGAASLPDENCLRQCAAIVGEELGWDTPQQQTEIRQLDINYPR